MNGTGHLFLLSFVLFCTLPSKAEAIGTVETESSAPVEIQGAKQEYVSEDGRRIVITALGNLITFESPRGFEHVTGGSEAPLDGYVLAYRDLETGTVRVLHNVYRSQSSTIEPGLPDFIPISFDGPGGGVVPRGTVLTGTVIVGTRDGLVQIRTTYSWTGGTIRVDSSVTSVVRTIRVISFKRQSRYAVDAAGAFSVREPKFDVYALKPEPSLESVFGPAVVFYGALCCRRSCDPGLCPPRLPEFNEMAVNTHSVLFQAGPDFAARDSLKPTYLAVADAKDACERVTSGPCAEAPLPRLEQDSLVTSGWIVNRKLVLGRSLRFVTRTTIF